MHKAEKLTASSAARLANRRTQPRAVVYGTPAAAVGHTPHAPPATCPITAPAISAAFSRRASVNADSSACVTPQARHRTRRMKPFRSCSR